MVTRAEWEGRRADIQRMVDDEWTDAEIGSIWNTSGASICRARKILGIATSFKRKSMNLAQVFGAQDVAPPAVVTETYIDEHGRTVTRFISQRPPYLSGALIQTVTARPRRG